MRPGQRLAHYTIVGSLGSGGMGEVYEADDAKLHRRVALKVLPADMTSGGESLARFRREAQAIAALSHPNIVTIYSVEEADDIHFITMELIEGRTLDERIADGGMVLETFFTLAIPMADAVAAAHDRGIVHRDLKPANVMVTADDRVKILDFGLAKVVEPDAPDDMTTVTGLALTQAGQVLGTVAYMSPEQAEGRTLDRRTDIFSLGVILYEMSTGRRPFIGDSSLAIMSAIVSGTPAPVADLNPALPPFLGRIIRKSLQKHPERRYQTALDLRNDLEELQHDLASDANAVSGLSPGASSPIRPSDLPGARRRGRLVAAFAGLLLIVTAAIGWPLGWFNRADTAPVFTLTPLTITGNAYAPAISPDGEWIAYASPSSDGELAIFLQGLGDRSAVQLTGDLGPVSFPAFSPDGTMLAFSQYAPAVFASPNPTVALGGIYVMGRMGGNVRQLTDRGFNPSWSPDGTRIVFGLDSVNGNAYSRALAPGLVVVDVATGAQTDLDVGDAVQPDWSPHGQRIAFWGLNAQSERDIYTVAADGSDRRPVTSDVDVDYSPVWSPDGRSLYFASTRGGPMAIWRIAIDERTGMPHGEAQQVSLGGLTEPGLLSLSSDGRRLVYQELLVQSRIDAFGFDPGRLRLDPGRQTIVRDSRRLSDLDVSPDGRWLAYATVDAKQDIYVARSDGGGGHQVTDDVAKDWRPRWSPDSSRLAFYSNASGSYEIWTANPDGTGRLRLTNAPLGINYHDPVWSPDGTEIMYFGSPGLDSLVVTAGLPFGQQTPHAIPRPAVDGVEKQFQAADWSRRGTIAGGGVTLYTPATGVFESLLLGPPVRFPRWMSDGRRVYYQRGVAWVALDTETRKEQVIDVPAETGGLRLSPDSRRAYLLTFQAQADIWMLEIR